MLRCSITSISSNSKTLWMRRSNIHFNQLPRRPGCYVVTFISINFEDALDATLQQNIHFSQLQDAVDATFQHPFQSTSQTLGCYFVTSISSNSKTLWMLRCNIHFKQLPGQPGCYLVTSIWINFEDALDATLQHNIHFNQLQDAVDATL